MADGDFIAFSKCGGARQVNFPGMLLALLGQAPTVSPKVPRKDPVLIVSNVLRAINGIGQLDALPTRWQKSSEASAQSQM